MGLCLKTLIKEGEEMKNYKEMKTGLQELLTDNYGIYFDYRHGKHFDIDIYEGDKKTNYSFCDGILKTNSAYKTKNTENSISDYHYIFDYRNEKSFEFDNKQGKKAFWDWLESFLIKEFNLNEYYFNFNSHSLFLMYHGVGKEIK